MATSNANPTTVESKKKRHKIIFTEIIVAKISAEPIHLLINNKTLEATSVIPTNSHI